MHRLPILAIAILACAISTVSGAAENAKTSHKENPMQTHTQNKKIALVIHGGAGVVSRDSIPDVDARLMQADLDKALDAGYEILNKGGNALDAVAASIIVLEDSPWFNAGKGSVFNAEGGHELDASVMEGHTRRAGAVAGVTTIKNPILLARNVMEKSEHVMLAGARCRKVCRYPKRYRTGGSKVFRYRETLKQLQDAKAKEAAHATHTVQGTYFGTVGAVALDQHGHIAAGTSTGRHDEQKVEPCRRFADYRCRHFRDGELWRLRYRLGRVLHSRRSCP